MTLTFLFFSWNTSLCDIYHTLLLQILSGHLLCIAIEDVSHEISVFTMQLSFIRVRLG